MLLPRSQTSDLSLDRCGSILRSLSEFQGSSNTDTPFTLKNTDTGCHDDWIRYVAGQEIDNELSLEICTHTSSKKPTKYRNVCHSLRFQASKSCGSNGHHRSSSSDGRQTDGYVFGTCHHSNSGRRALALSFFLVPRRRFAVHSFTTTS